MIGMEGNITSKIRQGWIGFLKIVLRLKIVKENEPYPIDLEIVRYSYSGILFG
jgi:hypothetical protein